MTGIERLRELADAVYGSVWASTSSTYCEKYGLSVDNIGGSLSDFLRAIDDQIEAEQEERVTRRAEDREAAEWVRDHGGLDAVRTSCGHADNRRVELCSALGVDLGTGWSDAMERMRPRLMPDSMEWPRFEDGEPLRIGDEISWKDDGGKVNSIELQDGGYFILHAADGAEDWILPQYFPGERVRRPAPKVLDADGVEIRVGDTVYFTEPWMDKESTIVERLEVLDDVVKVWFSDGEFDWPEKLTHRAPVLAADGEPLEVGQTVWGVSNGIEFTVARIPKSGEYQAVKLRLDDGAFTGLDPDQLTHQRPETRQSIVDEIGEEMAERIDKIVSAGRWN